MRARSIAPLALGAVALLARPREARPCSPWPDGVQAREVFPENAAVDVPTNARVIVEYEWYQLGDPGNVLELRVQGGGTVAAEASQSDGRGLYKILTPSSPLQSATTYELLDTLSFDCPVEYPPSCLGDPVVIATFTTGTGADTTPPVLSGVSLVSGYVCNEGTSCEYSDEHTLNDITAASAVDDRPWIFYEYLDDAGVLLAGPTRLVRAGTLCDAGSDGSIWVYVDVPTTFRIRAVDLAGNVESTSHQLVGETCEEAVVGTACDPDAVDAGVDAEPGPDGGSMVDGGGGGCNSGVGGSGFLAGGVFLLLWRARRATR